MPVTSSAAVTLLRVCLILSAVAASVFCGCGRTQADRTDMFVLVLVADALYWGDRCSRDALAWSEMTFGRSPSLRDSLDFPEIARLICPKPMLFVSGTDDPLFPAASAAEAYAEMYGIYSESGEKAAFSYFFSEGGHHCGQAVQDSIYAFFAGAVR